MVDIKYRVQRKRPIDLTSEEKMYVQTREEQKTLIQDKRPKEDLEDDKGLVWARTRGTVWRRVTNKEAEKIRQQRAGKRKRNQRQTLEIDSSEEERIPMMSTERNAPNPRKRYGERIASFWIDSGHTGALIGNGQGFNDIIKMAQVAEARIL